MHLGSLYLHLRRLPEQLGYLHILPVRPVGFAVGTTVIWGCENPSLLLGKYRAPVPALFSYALSLRSTCGSVVVFG